MAGRVADALEAIDLCEGADQVGEPALAVSPRVHVLAEQHDLACPRVDERRRFRNHVVPRPRDLGAARVRYDTIGTEFVAAFLDREESARVRPTPRRKGVELADRRHLGVDWAGAP